MQSNIDNIYENAKSLLSSRQNVGLHGVPNDPDTLLRKSNQLNSTNNQDSAYFNGAGTYFYGQNIDVNSLTSSINQLDASNIDIQHFPNTINNIDDFLRQKHEDIVNSTIASTKAAIQLQEVLDFDKYIQNDFENLRTNISPLIRSLKPESQPINQVSYENNDSKIMNPSFSLGDYQKCLQEFTEISKRNTGIQSQYNIIEKFKSIDIKNNNMALNFCWNLLNAQFKITQTSKETNISKIIIWNTIDFLQTHGRYSIEEIVKKNQNFSSSAISENTKLMHTITMYSKDIVRKYPNTEFVMNSERRYLWIELFLALRVGLSYEKIEREYKDLMNKVLTLEEQAPFWTLLNYFVSVRDNKVQSKSMKDINSSMNTMSVFLKRYINFNRNNMSQDPFKIGICHMLCNKDIYTNPSIQYLFPTIQDYLWSALLSILYSQQLSFGSNNTTYSLNDLSDYISKCGDKYFAPTDDLYLSYVQVLFMIQDYSKALNYMINKKQYLRAINFAYVIEYYLPNSKLQQSGSLLADTLRTPLQTLSSEDSTTYLYYIYRISVDEQLSDCLILYLVSIKDYSTVLGSISSSCKRFQSFLDKIFDNTCIQFSSSQPRDIISLVIQEAAMKANEQGMYQKSSLLAVYAGQFSYALNIYISKLAQTLNSEDSERNKIYNETQAFIESYVKPLQNFYDKNLYSLLYMFCKIEDTIELYNQKDYVKVLQNFTNIEIIPYQSTDGISNNYQITINIINMMQPSVVTAMPYVYYIYVDSLYHVYCTTLNKQGLNTNSSDIQQIKRQVKSLSNLIYRIPTIFTPLQNQQITTLMNKIV